MSWGQFWPLSGKFLPRVSYAFFAGKFLPSVRDSLIRWAYTLSWAPYLRAKKSVGFFPVVCTKEKGNLLFQESEAPVVKSQRGGGQGCEFLFRGV
jgi:hypothetical protein